MKKKMYKILQKPKTLVNFRFKNFQFNSISFNS